MLGEVLVHDGNDRHSTVGMKLKRRKDEDITFPGNNSLKFFRYFDVNRSQLILISAVHKCPYDASS